MSYAVQIVVIVNLLLNCGLKLSSATTVGKFQPTSNDNDDDYLSQKEHVLEKSYHGLIRENETLVEITPLIKVDEEKICDFRILKKPYHEIPFQIELVNNLGILKARRQLNCEKRKSYHFEIVAIFCDGTHSASANVHISVIDINEYAPIFLQPSYVTEVDEGRLYKEIIRVEAADKDCTPLFGDVCKYEILNNDQPFKIDNEGSIKNTEPLSHKASHNHILSVVAYDCAMKESAPIMVSIKVRRVCEPRLYGIPERIDYTTATAESLSLFPNAHIELCDMYCSGEGIRIRTTITLKTKHISFGCDRDISNCLHSPDRPVIDLLPRGVEWTKDLSYDEGFEPIFHFDGSSGVIVPDNLVQRHDFAIRPFSILTKFRHYSSPSANKHAKEHIICSADDHKMNRHHMALFVRNCRLILLLRKNFNEGDLNIFSPAEWRWKIPEVCDNEWHQYVLNIDQTTSQVELYIDGQKFYNSIGDHHNNPEVIDDWPLHAAHGVNTTLTVGACYQSSENRLKHTFNGDISEIKLSMRNLLTKDEIKCGTKCAEHLIPPSEHMIDSYQQIQSNYQLNEITIEGIKKSNIEQLLRKIQYINAKQHPTIGRRNIELRTTIMCMNQSAVRLPTVETYIMVNEPINMIENPPSTSNDRISSLSSSSSSMLSIKDDYTGPKKSQQTMINSIEIEDFSKHDSAMLSEQDKAKIYINGNTNNLVSYQEIKQGVRILDNINITVMSEMGGHIIQLPKNLQSLDSCSVIVFPSLNPDHEEIQVDGDESLSSTLDIKTNINKDGVEMIGYDSIRNYLDVLKALVYSNKKPAYYLNRVFKLSCSQLNSQFKSAEFTLTLTVLHPKQIVVTTTSPTSSNGGNVSGSSANSNEIYNLQQEQAQHQLQQKQQQQQLQQKQNPQQGQTINQQYDSNMFAHALIHSHDVQEPKSRVHSIVHNAQNSHPTLLIILICVFFVILLGGVSVARLRNNNHKFMDQNQACPKIADESLVWDDCALTITINPMQNDVVSEESSDSDNSDSDDEEVVNSSKYLNVSQLEWDNSTM